VLVAEHSSERAPDPDRDVEHGADPEDVEVALGELAGARIRRRVSAAAITLCSWIARKYAG
jgi:hypothetical protein